MKNASFLFLLFLFVISNVAGQSPLFTNKKSVTLGVQLSNPERDENTGTNNINNVPLGVYSITNKSYAGTLIYKYGLSETVNLRLKTGMTKINVFEQDENETNLSKQTQYHFSLGAEYRYVIKRATLLYGADVVYDHSGSFRNDNTSIQNSYSPNHYIIPGGRSTGVSVLLGFDVRLCRFLSFGFEYTPGLFYSKLGGTIQGSQFSTLATYDENFKIKQRIFFGIALILNSKKMP